MNRSKFFIFFIFMFLIASCTTSKRVSNSSTKNKSKSEKVVSKEANHVLKEAKKYLGVPYKYGGTTRSGLDCSGLVFNAYDAVGVKLPRISRDQANEGKEIKLRDVREGDLVFFVTSGAKISHVGIVEKIKNGEVFFIHSSTSKGVIISSIEETYWNKRFVKAVRVL